jgi:peptide subunit release factor 1 (eRF1)
MPTLAELNAQLDRLAAADTGPFPVLSLYLDLRPNENGRDNFEPFLRKELSERVGTYADAGPERDSLSRDADRIRDYVADVDKALNGLAIFACSGADLFEAVPLAAPVGEHRLFIGAQPHVYPLAKLLDQYPRYLALLADTHAARIFVFAANTVERVDHIQGTKTRRHRMGGWSQARYQRHNENFHLQHAKEVVDTVTRIARDEQIDRIVIAGDEVIVPLLRDQLPKDIADRVVDIVRLDIRAPEREVLEATIAALREKDAEGDRERVEALLDAYRSNGLGTVGLKGTKRAFELGQVDELLMPGSPDKLGDDADGLLTLARQTSARVRFIEDTALLAPLGGVGAFLRFRICGNEASLNPAGRIQAPIDATSSALTSLRACPWFPRCRRRRGSGPAPSSGALRASAASWPPTP